MKQANLLRGIAFVIVFRARNWVAVADSRGAAVRQILSLMRGISVARIERASALKLRRKALNPSDLRRQLRMRSGKFLDVRLGDC
jgi:hypothetical protein